MGAQYSSADKTRVRIIKAAKSLFARNGFSGTSTKSIADKAKMSDSLLFHHFKNKRKLWLAVKAEAVSQYNQQASVLPAIDLPFKSFIYKLINNSVDFFEKYPEVTRMLSWQRLESKAQPEIGVTTSTESEAWLSALKHYQTIGELNEKHKIEFVFTLLASTAASIALDPILFIQDPENRKQYIKFCADRFFEALK